MPFKNADPRGKPQETKTSPKGRLGSNEQRYGRTGVPKVTANVSQGAINQSTGSPRAYIGLGHQPASMSSTIVEPVRSQWPPYLNSLKNVFVQDAAGSNQAAQSAVGYSSVPSIKKPLASAKKANITGLSKCMPGRGRVATGPGHQNFGYRPSGGKPEAQSHKRGTKQLRSDSPRQHQDCTNQLTAKEDMFQRVVCQTQISACSGGGSTSPHMRGDSKSGHSIGQIKQQNTFLATAGRASRASESQASRGSQGAVQHHSVRGVLRNNNPNESWGLGHQSLGASQMAMSTGLNGTQTDNRPQFKMYNDHTMSQKTQHSMAKSPRGDTKPIYIATEGAETNQTVESMRPVQISQSSKPMSQRQLTVVSQSQVKAMGNSIGQPRKGSRNQLTLAYGRQRQNQFDTGRGSHAVSRNVQKYSTGRIVAKSGSRALQTSPSIQMGSQKNRREVEGVAVNKSNPAMTTFDHKVPTATLHLAEPTVGPLKTRQSGASGRSGKLGSPEPFRSSGSGALNPRRPSGGFMVGPLSRTILVDSQDSSKWKAEPSERNSYKSKTKKQQQSPRSTQQRNNYGNKSPQRAEKSRSRMSVRSSASRGSTRPQQRGNGQAGVSRESDRRIHPFQSKATQQSQPGTRISQQKIMTTVKKSQRFSNIHQVINKKGKDGLRGDQDQNPSDDRAALSVVTNDTPVFKPENRNSKAQLKIAQSGINGLGSGATTSVGQTGKSSNNPSINRLRSYSPKVHLSELQNAQAVSNSNTVTTEQRTGDGTLMNPNQASSERAVELSASTPQIAQISVQKKIEVADDSGSRKGHYQLNSSDGSYNKPFSPIKQKQNKPNANDNLRQKTSEHNKNENSIGSSPTIRQQSTQQEQLHISKPQTKRVQVSRTFLSMVQNLSKNIQTQLNPRQMKDFEKSLITLMTDKASEIDPYLNVKCFQISPYNIMALKNDTQYGRSKIQEQGNLLHFLSASGYFPGILDYVLRKKCKLSSGLDKNELSIENFNGLETVGHSSLHLACLSLKQKSIEKLLLSRVDANLAGSKIGDTPLHSLIKMYEQQVSNSSQQIEDIGVDVDLDDIRECIQLILPFCEESLTKINKEGVTPIDLITNRKKGTSHPLESLIEDHYEGVIDLYKLQSNCDDRLQSNRMRSQDHPALGNIVDNNIDLDYVEVNDEELEEFATANREYTSTARGSGWRQNPQLQMLEKDGLSGDTPIHRSDKRNNLYRNYQDQQDRQNQQKCKIEEGLNQSAQQAQQKDSTKSIRETSRKQDMTDLQDDITSPFGDGAILSSGNKEHIPNIPSLQVNLAVDKRSSILNQNKNEQMLKEEQDIGRDEISSSNQNKNAELTDIQQSQFILDSSNDVWAASNTVQADQRGEQSDLQDRHSGLGFAAINTSNCGMSREQIDPFSQVSVPSYQTGGLGLTNNKSRPYLQNLDPDTTQQKQQTQLTESAPTNKKTTIDNGEKQRELQRQLRSGNLEPIRRIKDGPAVYEYANDKEKPQMHDKPNDSPENITQSNISPTDFKQNDQNRLDHCRTVHAVYTAQTLQSINTKKQAAYLQDRGRANNRPENLTVQTIYNVDTPEKAYNLHLNDNMSEGANHEQESGYGGAIDFDNVSSLKQNIKRMQMSVSRKSAQSGADSRLSRRSQRPLKLANKKVIGNDSFVITVGGNEADFAESEQKQGGGKRIPPEFKSNPSQSSLGAPIWNPNGHKQMKTNSSEFEKNYGERKYSKERVKEEIGPDCFLTHQLLGTGSFGEVFLVEEKSTGKLMALKVLSKKKAKEQKLLKYNFAEKEIMARMTIANHPFIVKLYYTFQTQESLFMAMEFCAGGDLSQYLEVEGCFNETKAKQYICEIVCAVQALHANDIIFRDLKPDNIVLDSDGHAMLVDFGLSRQQVKGASSGADSFCGSYAYLAPEMIKKKGHGKAVDWYLIGVVLYELLTGMPPFYDDDKQILFKNITNTQLEFPSDLELPLTRECKDLIKQLLHKEPTRRLGYQNGVSDIKAHPFFDGVDWSAIEQKKYQTPDAYLAEMALSIIRKDPYALRDHPRTKGKLTRTGDPGHLDGWEVNLVRDYNICIKAPSLTSPDDKPSVLKQTRK